VFFFFLGNFPVPEFAQKFPIFKGTNNMPKRDPIGQFFRLFPFQDLLNLWVHTSLHCRRDLQ
ncbi:MAG: hypothetical protein KDK56_10630, partial [Simkania sp.]|nr:hypothetical protein [Simkania sp.]